MRSALEERLDHRLDRNRRRTQTVGTRVTLTEEKELVAAATKSGCSISEWSREALLSAARLSKSDAVFTELIATRMLLVNLLKPLALGEKVTAAWITEAMTMVRKEKHKAAQEVMQQYTLQTGKETSDGNTMG